MYIIFLISFLLSSLSCWAHPPQIIMFSVHGKAKTQFKISSALLEILLQRSFGVEFCVIVKFHAVYVYNLIDVIIA